jgi:hypothetical protein
MMFMAKFGKFKIRLIATVSLSAILSIFNLASATTNYWVKYMDNQTNEPHFAGLWRSCPNQGPCIWKNGIVDYFHTLWSICVRLFFSLGTIGNLAAIVVFFMAFMYKTNKKKSAKTSKYVIKLMSLGTHLLIGAFLFAFIGFCIFISNSCNYGMWFQMASMIILIITSNMITRTFAILYYQNIRSGHCMKSVETGISHSKLPCDPEEKIALAPVSKDANTNTGECNGDAGITKIDMNKVSEANGSNEALIQNADQTTSAPTIAVMDVTENSAKQE